MGGVIVSRFVSALSITGVTDDVVAAVGLVMSNDVSHDIDKSLELVSTLVTTRLYFPDLFLRFKERLNLRFLKMNNYIMNSLITIANIWIGI